MFCPKCKSEYVKGITVCKACNVKLVDKLPEEGRAEIETREIDGELKYEEVFITFNPSEVALIKSILDNAGIKYIFKGEHFQIVQPWIDPARLMVREDQVEDALELLKDLDFGTWPSDDEKS